MQNTSLALFVRKLRDPSTSSSVRGEDLRAHRDAIDEFLATVLQDQPAHAAAAAERRRQPRIQRCVGIDLQGGRCGVTLDVGLGGFSALLARPPSATAPLPARLRLTQREAIAGEVAVTSVSSRRGSCRVSFRFTTLAEADRDRLELFLLRQLLGARAAEQA